MMRLVGLFVFGLVAVLPACSPSEPLTDSRSNWLRVCDADSQCGSELSCLCGVCTKVCESDGDCDDSTSCIAVHELVDCSSDASVCASTCTADEQCDEDQACLQGTCVDSGCRGDEATQYFQDADEDGYGNGSSWVMVCEAPVGYVENGDDCADQIDSSPNCGGLVGAECNPGFSGMDDCDGVDNDCDLEVDEDCIAPE